MKTLLAGLMETQREKDGLFKLAFTVAWGGFLGHAGEDVAVVQAVPLRVLRTV